MTYTIIAKTSLPLIDFADENELIINVPKDSKIAPLKDEAKFNVLNEMFTYDALFPNGGGCPMSWADLGAMLRHTVTVRLFKLIRLYSNNQNNPIDITVFNFIAMLIKLDRKVDNNKLVLELSSGRNLIEIYNEYISDEILESKDIGNMLKKYELNNLRNYVGRSKLRRHFIPILTLDLTDRNIVNAIETEIATVINERPNMKTIDEIQGRILVMFQWT